MSEAFDKLRARRSRLPDPPPDASDNLLAPEVAPTDVAPQPTSITRTNVGAVDLPPPQGPRLDGRARLRKNRTEPLSTKIKPSYRDLLMSLADAYEATISETLEKALDALAVEAKRTGKMAS